jgi:uncharacterized repeat protein (TIGR03803 family)
MVSGQRSAKEIIMTNPAQHFTLLLSRSLRGSALALALAYALTMIATQLAQAQTFTVLHNFTGGTDGAYPYVGVTEDSSGNLYGTAALGGMAGGCNGNGCGTVYKLARHGSGWLFSPLYGFTGGSDGAVPLARVILGPNGTLYGTTYIGGGGTGVVFNLHPPGHVSGRVFSPWNETVLYQFGNVFDGNNPEGDLLFDAAGDIYGTTSSGGYECLDTVYCGTVYELTHNGSSWTESILYEFTNGDVAIPLAGVISDHAGNLYGTTSNLYAVFELIRSESGWTEATLYQPGYQGGAPIPSGGVIFDPSGNLYGTTQSGGTNGVGTVFELMTMGGSWSESTLYNFTGGGTPDASLVRDASGNLYGTTCVGGAHNSGSVFKLVPSGGAWTETDLYDFTGGSDGYCPMGNVILDAQGNIYGTAYAGGSDGYGTVFEITP